MPIKINNYPSKQKPDLIRTTYLPIQYYSPQSYRYTSRYSQIRTLRTKRDTHPNKFMPQAQERSGAKPYHETIYRRGVKLSNADTYYTVTDRTEGRLDTISQIHYNTPILWWVIAQANAVTLFNAFNIPRGTILRIPSLTSLYESGGYLSAQ